VPLTGAGRFGLAGRRAPLRAFTGVLAWEVDKAGLLVLGETGVARSRLATAASDGAAVQPPAHPTACKTLE
jgi:hypothetical protein